MTKAHHTQKEKIQEIMFLVEEYKDVAIGGFSGWDERMAIESKLRELVREHEEAKKYLDMLAMCMFKNYYAQDEPYASGAVKFELFDSLSGVVSQIDNMVSGLERAHGITNASN